MTRAEEVLLKELRYIASISNGQVKRVADGALASVSEYLATEPSGERADLIARQRGVQENGINAEMRELAKATVNMLEADAQPKKVTCQIYGHVVGACVECNTHIEAQQAKRVPMAGEEIEKIADGCRAVAGSVWPHAFARAIEAHHGITPK